MTFWFSPNLGNFLFDGFVVETVGAFVATCFGLGAIAVLLELLKFVSTRAKIAFNNRQIQNSHSGGNETSALLSGTGLRGNIDRVLHISGEISLYFTQVSSNWIVMLAVMGYNGYIFLSVVIGAGLGYAFFGESVAYAKIQNMRRKAGVIVCGECQVKDEPDMNAPGQSDPPTGSRPIPSISGSAGQEVTVHHFHTSGESI